MLFTVYSTCNVISYVESSVLQQKKVVAVVAVLLEHPNWTIPSGKLNGEGDGGKEMSR
jgi:hypothetical protein